MANSTGTEKKRYEVKYKKIDFNDLQFDQGDSFVDSGMFGDVKKAKWSGRVVAVKCFPTADRKGGFSEELVCLSRLQPHKNIVAMHGACVAERPFIVMELAPLTLDKVLHKQKKSFHYTSDHVINWSLQMTTALDYIHGLKMIHRDIKPSNILLFENGQLLKLCDFGTSRKLESTLMTNAVGTACYMAPEVIKGRHYTDRCDVFSFGIVLWEMIARRRPFLNEGKGPVNSMAIFWAMANGARPPQIKNIPRVMSEMITSCWEQEYKNRPPVEELKKKFVNLSQYFELSKPLITVTPRRHKPKKEEPASNNLARDRSASEVVRPLGLVESSQRPKEPLRKLVSSPAASERDPPKNEHAPRGGYHPYLHEISEIADHDTSTQ